MGAADSSVRFGAGGPGADAVSDGNTALARATVGRVDGQLGFVAVGAEGPNAGAQARLGNGEAYAGVQASLVCAELKDGPLAIRFEPNVNTGAGVRNGNVEGSLVGFGGAIGKDGVSIKTPIGSADCSVM